MGEKGDDDFVELVGGVVAPAEGSRGHLDSRGHFDSRGHYDSWGHQFGEGGALRFEVVLETEQRSGDGARLRPGKADDAEAAASGRSGDGDDGVVEGHRSV